MKESTAPLASRASARVLPPLRSERLLDQVRERVRYLHFSIRTEQAYVHWVRAFVRFHEMRHPAEMGAAEVEAFLSWLAAERRVAVSTDRQALSAIVFLYQKVLGFDLPWLAGIGRPHAPRRLRSPLDLLRLGPPTMAAAEASLAAAAAGKRDVNADVDVDGADEDRDQDEGHADLGRRPHAREPALCYRVLPCYRATPSSTARATSAS